MDDLRARLPVRGRNRPRWFLLVPAFQLPLLVSQAWQGAWGFVAALGPLLLVLLVLYLLPDVRIDERGVHGLLSRTVPWSDVVEVKGVSRWRSVPELVLGGGRLLTLPKDLPLSESDLRRLAGLDLVDDPSGQVPQPSDTGTT